MSDNSFAGRLGGGPSGEENPHDAAKRVKARLQRGKDQGEANLARLTADLERARADGVTGATLEKLKRRVDDYRGLHEWALEQDRNELATLEAKIAEEQNALRLAAARALGAQKQAARDAWLDRGGDLSSFERAWPGIEAQILQEQVSAALSEDPVAAAIRHKRGEYSL